ncbi:MAG: hypothetical protein HOV79_11705 [Hamadaea sp.]|nr:hypothetical protein [Hamadaea sp.]
MLDARDNGDDPLSASGRRSLMWSGLHQRFASRPYVWAWIALTLLSLGLLEWVNLRNIRIEDEAERLGMGGSNPASFVTYSGAAVVFVACFTILTVSLLHRPALPRPVEGVAARRWPVWALVALGAMALAGLPPALGSLIVGVSRYRAGGGFEFRLLAIASAVVIGFQLVFMLPVVNLLFVV